MHSRVVAWLLDRLQLSPSAQCGESREVQGDEPCCGAIELSFTKEKRSKVGALWRAVI